MIRLAEIFQNRMVLQRHKPIRIWGTSDSAQQIRVQLNGKEILQTQLTKGDFSFDLPAQKALYNAELCILAENGEQICLHQVDIGEVWIAGGQSNMEFMLRYDREGTEVCRCARNDHLRFYDVGEYAYEGQREWGVKRNMPWDRWMRFYPEEAVHFSAVGAYFGMYLSGVLAVPVGIIGCNWGGTTASAWLDEGLLRNDAALKVYTDRYDRALSDLDLELYLKQEREFYEQTDSVTKTDGLDNVFGIELTNPPSEEEKAEAALWAAGCQTGPHSENRPGGLYASMVKKIIGYAVSGVLWYQGESDDQHADIYAALLTALIKCWRTDWREELPFLIVQLAPFEESAGNTGKNYPLLRTQQQLVENTMPGVYVASIMDAGSRYDIHPKEKRPVGERLARLALEEVYHITGITGHAPLFLRTEKEYGKITVYFSHTGAGLEEKGDVAALFCLSAAGENEKAIPVSAVVKTDRVTLHSPEIRKEERYVLSFADVPYCRMSLYGNNGLAARPFGRTKI